MAEVDRYLVVWGKKGEYTEGFQLWRSAMLWHKTLLHECDANAKILYWHASSGEYREASLPAEAEITRLPLFAPLAQRHGRV